MEEGNKPTTTDNTRGKKSVGGMGAVVGMKSVWRCGRGVKCRNRCTERSAAGPEKLHMQRKCRERCRLACGSHTTPKVAEKLNCGVHGWMWRCARSTMGWMHVLCTGVQGWRSGGGAV